MSKAITEAMIRDAFNQHKKTSLKALASYYDFAAGYEAALSAGQAQPMSDDWRKRAASVLEGFDKAKAEPLVALANYGDIALSLLRSALAAPPAVPGEVERENAKLVELIKTRFLGVHPDELDCYLEYDDWTRIIAALSVPLPEIEGGDKGDGWQPIETAPLDKTPIIIAVPTKDQDDFIVGEAYFDPKHYGDGGGWWWAGTNYGDYHSGPISEVNYHGPSFWRPLPAAPCASIEGETP